MLQLPQVWNKDHNDALPEVPQHINELIGKMQDGMKRRMTHTQIPGQKVENDQAQDRSRNRARNSLLICTLPQAGATH